MGKPKETMTEAKPESPDLEMLTKTAKDIFSETAAQPIMYAEPILTDESDPWYMSGSAIPTPKKSVGAWILTEDIHGNRLAFRKARIQQWRELSSGVTELMVSAAGDNTLVETMVINMPFDEVTELMQGVDSW